MNSMGRYCIALICASRNSELSSTGMICMKGRDIHFLLPVPIETWKLESSGATKSTGEREWVPQSLLNAPNDETSVVGCW